MGFRDGGVDRIGGLLAKSIGREDGKTRRAPDARDIRVIVI